MKILLMGWIFLTKSQFIASLFFFFQFQVKDWKNLKNIREDLLTSIPT